MRGLGGKKLIKYIHSVFLFSIYIYKTFLSRQLKFTNIYDINNSIMQNPRLFLFSKSI